MPILLGVVLGVFLTVAGAFLYDSTTGRAANGLSPTAGGGNPPMVNWDVVNARWQGLQSGLREVSAEIERGWKKLKNS
jgi:hypothetical protein